MLSPESAKEGREQPGERRELEKNLYQNLDLNFLLFLSPPLFLL